MGRELRFKFIIQSRDESHAWKFAGLGMNFAGFVNDLTDSIHYAITPLLAERDTLSLRDNGIKA